MNQISRIFGIAPVLAKQLEKCGVRTLADLASQPSLDLSARTGIPMEWFNEWVPYARQEVAAQKHRRHVALTLMVVAATLLSGILVWSHARKSQISEVSALVKQGNVLLYVWFAHDSDSDGIEILSSFGTARKFVG